MVASNIGGFWGIISVHYGR